jgi:predicted dienelactone hydrolase
MESDAEHRQPFRDDRVRAAFAIAPALGEAFTPAGLAGVSIPVLIVVGAADQAAPAAVNAAHFARHITGAELRLPDGPVAHYTFLSEATDAGRQTLPDLTLDPPGVDRAAVHHLVAGWALDFFNRTLG